MQKDKTADFYDVYAGSEDMRGRVYRFEGTEQGFLRAKSYSRKYNESLRDAMGLTEADLDMKADATDLNNPEQYETLQKVESYYDHSASVRSGHRIPVVKDGDPLPTDYPHDF